MKIFIALFLSVAASHADQLLLADMGKLSDSQKRDDEVARLSITGDDYTLVRYQFLKASQPGGKQPLHVLAAERQHQGFYVSSSSRRSLTISTS